MATGTEQRRTVLGAVARGEVVRDVYDTDRWWLGGAYNTLPPSFAEALRALESDGLAVPPGRQPGDRADRRWELTDKALES